MQIKVAKYISEFFVKNGIKDCFMVTGGGAMHLDDAIGHEEGIHCTFNHHEQACAIAAEGYTRMTGIRYNDELRTQTKITGKTN